MQDEQNNATWQRDAKEISGEVKIVCTEEVPISAMPPRVVYLGGNAEGWSVSCGGVMGMFIKGDTVDFTVSAPSLLGSIKYKVRNTLNGETFKGTVAVEQSGGRFRLDFTRAALKAGHYRLTLKLKENAVHAYFAIIHKNREKHFDSPFGVDHASAWHVPREKREAYARLIDALGVGWVRERIRLNDICTPNGYDFENYDHAFGCLKRMGVKISVTFHDQPQWLCRHYAMGDSLEQVRAVAQRIGEHFKEVVDAWEIWNEQDVTYFTGGMPDEYSAFVKAFAIGLEDSGASCLRVLGAYARVPDRSDYGRCMMNNQLMDYMQVYNFHTYVFPAKSAAPALDKEATVRHMENCRTNGNKAAWLTETGAIIMRPEDQGTLLKNYQCALYTATAAIEAAYYGVDKVFPFMLPGYYEGGVGFGMMSDDETLLPEYSALAALCYNLGKGRVMGRTTLGVHGYAVDTGKDEVLVLWSHEEREVVLPADTLVMVADMNGREKCCMPSGGVLRVRVGVMPKYLHFNRIPREVYLAEETEVRRPEAERLTEECRLVVKAVLPKESFPYFPNPHKGEGEVITSGYLLKKGENDLILKCCNFTDRDREVGIGFESDGATLIAPRSVLLKAGEERDVQAVISFNNACDMSIFLLNGEKRCSVAFITLEEADRVEKAL